VRLVRDDLGTPVDIADVVRRVVSLVPSLTESIAREDPDALIAATDWCSHPPELQVQRVRGTKNPDVRHIIAMRPDLVVANQEENRRIDVERLRGAGVAVWVSRTHTVPDAIEALRRMFTDALGWAEPAWLGSARDTWCGAPPEPRRRVAIAVWRDPWMVVGRDTFAGDLAARLGLTNVFADHSERYPHVSVEAIEAARPDVVLLPDEPYPFTPTDGPEAFTVPTAVVDGRALTWYGPSLLTARSTLLEALS
jgi:ABC-type Fe3+-hydroxamate transport system substrate-binding protein